MTRLKLFFQSFSHAIRGMLTVFRFEQSFRLQIIAALLVVVFSKILAISRNEFIVVLLLIVSVLTLEIINSILERLVDAFKPRIHPMVKEVKDMMAAAVLLVSLFAVVIGWLIFYPYIKLPFFV